MISPVINKEFNRNNIEKKWKKMRREKNVLSVIFIILAMFYLLALIFFEGYENTGFLVGGVLAFSLVYGLLMTYLFFQGRRYRVVCPVCGWSLSTLYGRQVVDTFFEQGVCPKCLSKLIN